MREPWNQNKVDRLIQEYEFPHIGRELEHRWIGKERPRESLRDLADYLNRRLLKTCLQRVNEDTVEGEIENLYRLLTDDEVAANARTQAETTLSRAGIDVESLREDFVSHQAIHTYLTKVRGASLPSNHDSSTSTIDKRRDSIQRLRNRLIAVVEWNIETLRDANHISIGSFDVTVGVTIHCKDCNMPYSITGLFNQKHCDCNASQE